jgi:hypothetical protein
MAVAVARPFPSGNGKQIDLDVTRRSLVRVIQQVLPSAVFGRLVDIRNDEVTAIVSSDADTARELLKALRRHGFGRRAAGGLAAGVGVSLDTTEVACLSQSLEEARLALEFASAAEPLMHFGDIDLPEFLIRRADRTALRLIPEWTRHFHRGRRRSGRRTRAHHPHVCRVQPQCETDGGAAGRARQHRILQVESNPQTRRHRSAYIFGDIAAADSTPPAGDALVNRRRQRLTCVRR